MKAYFQRKSCLAYRTLQIRAGEIQSVHALRTECPPTGFMVDIPYTQGSGLWPQPYLIARIPYWDDPKIWHTATSLWSMWSWRLNPSLVPTCPKENQMSQLSYRIQELLLRNHALLGTAYFHNGISLGLLGTYQVSL